MSFPSGGTPENSTMAPSRRYDWCYSPDYGQLCRIIETQTLWGETVCRVWLPGKDIVMGFLVACLRPIFLTGVGTVDGIAYLAVAARVADALT